MHIRPLWFRGPKMKDFKRGVKFEIKEAPEHLQSSLVVDRLEKKGLFRRKGELHVHDAFAYGALSAVGAQGTAADTIALKVRKTFTGRIRYIDANGKKHKLEIMG